MFHMENLQIKTVCHTVAGHTGPLFNKHNVLNVFDTFILELGVFMYKYQANLLPKTFSNYFVKHNQIHIQQEMLKIIVFIKQKKEKKMFSDRSIWIAGPSLWNSLGTKMKHCKTTQHFRSELNSSLISEYD